MQRFLLACLVPLGASTACRAHRGRAAVAGLPMYQLVSSPNISPSSEKARRRRPESVSRTFWVRF